MILDTQFNSYCPTDISASTDAVLTFILNGISSNIGLDLHGVNTCDLKPNQIEIV